VKGVTFRAPAAVADSPRVAHDGVVRAENFVRNPAQHVGIKNLSDGDSVVERSDGREAWRPAANRLARTIRATSSATHGRPLDGASLDAASTSAHPTPPRSRGRTSPRPSSPAHAPLPRRSTTDCSDGRREHHEIGLALDRPAPLHRAASRLPPSRGKRACQLSDRRPLPGSRRLRQRVRQGRCYLRARCWRLLDRRVRVQLPPFAPLSDDEPSDQSSVVCHSCTSLRSYRKEQLPPFAPLSDDVCRARREGLRDARNPLRTVRKTPF